MAGGENDEMPKKAQCQNIKQARNHNWLYIFKLWSVFFLYVIKEVESKEEREHFFSFSGNTGEEIEDTKERKKWSWQGKNLHVRM